MFKVGGHMDQVFEALIDRSRSALDLKTVKTILGYKRRPRYRQRKGKAVKSAQWEITVEKPTADTVCCGHTARDSRYPQFDLTIFKLQCGKLTLKIYTKGERVLRIEAMAHNIQELDCGRILEKFPQIVSRRKGVLERFVNALSWIDQCFISDDALEQLPSPSRVGKSKVGGIDFNKPNALGRRSGVGTGHLSQRVHRFRIGRESSNLQQAERIGV